MARFSNLPSLGASAPATPTARNAAGGVAYANDAKTSFALQLITSFMSGDHYRDETAQLEQLATAAQAVGDWQWVAKAAVYARDALGMRTSSHFVTAVIAASVSGEPWLRRFYSRVVVRPDDMCEIVAAYMLLRPGAGIPNALKRGFADRFARFDEYQLAKYKGGSRTVRLVDVMRLCHAKGPLVNKLAKDELATPQTWETGLSAAKTKLERASVWQNLVAEGKLGYMALLRNLRNIAHDAPHVLNNALHQLKDVGRMRRAKVFPFRLATALMLFDDSMNSGGSWGHRHRFSSSEPEIDQRTRDKIVDALSEALDKSVDVVPEFDGPTMIAVDTSASMRSPVSQRSSVQCVTAAMLLGAVMAKKNRDSDVCIFANTAELVRFGTRNQPVSTIVQTLTRNVGKVGHGTNMASIVPLIQRGQYKRVFVMSDMQGWYGDIEELSRWTAKGKWCYLWNLSGSDGTSQIDTKYQRLVQLGGFSDKVFESVPLNESGPAGIVEAIDKQGM